MTTGERIYTARKGAGMTQEELADRLGVSRQAVSKWESDTAFPETDKLIELCKLFSLSADELLLGEKTHSAEIVQTDNEEKNDLACYGRIAHAGEIHFEYVSKAKWGSLPLLHINFGLGNYRAKGVVAIGNIATGLVSIGFLSIGILALGLLSLGLLAFGTLAVGLLVGAGAIAAGALAFGGVAIGIMTFGGCCVGYIAVGGATFGQYAMGGAAHGYVAVGSQSASGTHAFIMPRDFDTLCEFLRSHVSGGLAELIKNISRSLN